MTDSLLMYAIFALDAYNEDPTTAQLKVTLSDDQLGDATLINNPSLLPAGSAAVGFFATTYEWDGQDVVSYRGTLTDILKTEILNGYGVGAGLSLHAASLRCDQILSHHCHSGGSVTWARRSRRRQLARCQCFRHRTLPGWRSRRLRRRDLWSERSPV